MLIKNKYSVELFSKYRNELMGIAIIGVLVVHVLSFGKIEASNLGVTIIFFISRLAFTQGFLFLSGFGLYYSFKKNNNLKKFYLRRMNRLLIPFIILSGWFFLFRDFYETFNPLNFFLHISSLAFWIEGNYYGMWYVSISVFLYILFPFLYTYINKIKGAPVIFVMLVILLDLVIQHFFLVYYNKVSIGIDKIPIFIVGIYAGKISLYKKQKESIRMLLFTVILWIISFFLKNHWEYVYEIYAMTEKIIYMFIICILFSVSENQTLVKYIRKILRWFGRYSLELYVLHLLIFSFLSSEILFSNITPIIKVSIMILGVLLLCIPFHKLNDVIVKKINFNEPAIMDTKE